MKFRPALFWDTDPAKIDPQKHARYIIERIMEMGDINDARWCVKTYGRDSIKKILPTLHISRKSSLFWQQYL